MMGARGGRRLGLLALACAAGLTACRDSGLPDRNLPLAEARHRQYSYAAYQPLADNTPLALGGRHWIRSAELVTIPQGTLEPVGAAGGVQLYAVRGARAPYSRLYSQVSEGRWAPYLRLN